MRRIPLLPVALAASLAAAALPAATPINQVRPLDPRGRVDIENLKGRIEVRAWDRNEVGITGSLGDGVEKLVVEGDRQHLVVRAEYPRNIGGWGRRDRTGPTTLVLRVPLQAALRIESVAADISVTGVAPRELDIDSISGDVVVAGAPRQASIDSVSGRQQLTLNTAGEIRSDSVSGDVVLRGRLGGEVHAETVSGRISIDSSGQALRRLALASVSGDAEARVALANGGGIRAETVSGDVRLTLPKTLSARVAAESFSGTLRAPGAKVRKEEYGPGSSLDARYGSGSGEIRIETFSGDATLDFN